LPPSLLSWRWCFHCRLDLFFSRPQGQQQPAIVVHSPVINHAPGSYQPSKKKQEQQISFSVGKASKQASFLASYLTETGTSKQPARKEDRSSFASGEGLFLLAAASSLLPDYRL
jgi:hypothetical protein